MAPPSLHARYRWRLPQTPPAEHELGNIPPVLRQVLRGG